MTTRHHGNSGSSSDAEWRVSEDEGNMQDVELTELGPLLTSPESQPRVRDTNERKHKKVKRHFLKILIVLLLQFNQISCKVLPEGQVLPEK